LRREGRRVLITNEETTMRHEKQLDSQDSVPLWENSYGAGLRRKANTPWPLEEPAKQAGFDVNEYVASAPDRAAARERSEECKGN
jgi:hypothetical protein